MCDRYAQPLLSRLFQAAGDVSGRVPTRNAANPRTSCTGRQCHMGGVGGCAASIGRHHFAFIGISDSDSNSITSTSTATCTMRQVWSLSRLYEWHRVQASRATSTPGISCSHSVQTAGARPSTPTGGRRCGNRAFADARTPTDICFTMCSVTNAHNGEVQATAGANCGAATAAAKTD